MSGKVTKPKDMSVATLTMIVEFDEVPSKLELEELLDAARAIGAIRQADFSILKPVTTSLIRVGDA